MVKTAPSAPLEVPEANLLFKFLIVTLDAPTQFGRVDQVEERDGFRKRRKPVFGRLGLALRPLNQQPFFGWLLVRFVTWCDGNTHARKARR